MSRGVFLLGIGIAVVTLAFTVTDWVIGPIPVVTEAQVRRIRDGMTLQEVEALLARPPSQRIDAPDGKHGIAGGAIYYWAGHAGGIVVGLNQAGRVTEAKWLDDQSSLSLFDRIRSWLGW